MTMRETAIKPTIDLDADGIQHGHLQLPYSRDDSAWGSILIPICVIRNGTGPTALVTGANHGDEYEGPLAILDFAQTVNLGEVSGCILLVPFMNQPAFVAGTRTSPIDRGNMNRAFPGRPDGTVTEKIADYFQRYLLPRADIVLDFHSGGSTLDFLPFAASHLLDDPKQEARCRAAREAFNAPFSMEMLEIDSVGMYDNAAEAQGKTFVTTELGGGGSSTPATVEVARKGLRNLLIHAGILKGTPEPSQSRHLSQRDEGCFHFSPCAGLVEYAVSLGDSVATGALLARIWPITATGIPRVDIHAQTAGLVVTRHAKGLIQSGDCLAVLAQEDI